MDDLRTTHRAEPEENLPVIDYAVPKVRARSWPYYLFVASIVVVSAMVVIVMVLPSVDSPRISPPRVSCASNMRQIGQALLLYANENEGRYPAALEPLLLTQDITPDVFCCPSSYDTPAPGASVEERSNALLQGVHLSYIYLGHEKGAQAPADAVILYEPLANHDGDGMNILFGDGHVEFVDAQTAQKLIRDATSNTSATTQASER